MLELFHLRKYEFVRSLWWRCVTLRTNLWAFEDSSCFEMQRDFYICNRARISAVAILLMVLLMDCCQLVLMCDSTGSL